MATPRTRTRLAALALGGWFALTTPSAFAQSPAGPVEPPVSSAPSAPSASDSLMHQLDALESDPRLEPVARDALVAELAGTRALLERAAARRGAIDAYEREARERESIVAALAAGPDAPLPASPWPDPDASLGALTAGTEALENAAAEAIATAFVARREESALAARATTIAAETADAMHRVGDDLARPSSDARETWGAGGGTFADGSGERGDPGAAGAVRALIERVHREEGALRTADLRRELATLPARQAIAAARTRVAVRRVARLSRVLERYHEALGAARVEDAGAQVVGFGRRLDTASDGGTSGTERAREDLALARRRLQLLGEEWQLARERMRERNVLLTLHATGDTIDAVVGAGIAPDGLAVLLRGLDDGLPETVAPSSTRLERARRARSALQVERFGWEQRLRGLSLEEPVGLDPPGAANDVADDAAPARDTAWLLGALIDDANRVSDRLVEREIVLQESIARADAISAFLTRSLLRLRSAESAGLAWIERFPAGMRWMADARAWRDVGTTLFASGSRYRVRTALFASIVIGLLLLRPRLGRRLGELSGRVGHVGRDGFWVTPIALLLAVLRSVPLPSALAFTSLQLTLPDGTDTRAAALGVALGELAPVLFALLLFRTLARRDGVLHRHFGWSEVAARKLRRQLSGFVPLAMAAGLVLSLALGDGGDEIRYGLGVPAFLVLSLAIAALTSSVFHPSNGVAAAIVPQSQTPRIMIALYPLLLLVPLTLGALALTGYFDTAIELQSRAFGSLLLAMVVTIVHGLALRAFGVAHRRFALRRARRLRARREADRLDREARPVSGDAVPTARPEADRTAIDVARVERQARTVLIDVAVLLLLLGLWAIWRPLFPAFGVADGIVLWPASGEGGAVGGVTLRNVVVALFLITVGLIASRNIRGILEIGVFERLRLDAGARYAIVAITGYVLVGASLVAGLAQLGVDWSKLQWIVAALGVGLGFGLQEIVANFVSGLIILFERPVRVGDVVTIGNLSGTVSNIRIRATTVTDFDNLEVLLPNKTIITENVVNWTLSDSVTRLMLDIGVAYGSDIERVRTLLEQAIAATEDVLDEPTPTVFFVRHGDSALEFELRVFVATPAHRLPVTHALNARIHRLLAEAGIEIPFPERSVRIRHEAPRGEAPGSIGAIAVPQAR